MLQLVTNIDAQEIIKFDRSRLPKYAISLSDNI